MLRRAAWRDPASLLWIGLSLWMALPAFQWCAVDWEACRIQLARTAACEPACSSEETGCDLASCPLARGCDASAPTGSSRAWCVGAHADGVVPREWAPPLPDVSSVVAIREDPGLPAPPRDLRAERVDRAGLCHGVVAAHAPPLTRAPPPSA